MFYFAFCAPKVREVDATVCVIRALEIRESCIDAARKIYANGYLAPATPVPFYVGVQKPMGVYSWITCCSPTPWCAHGGLQDHRSVCYHKRPLTV